MAYLSHSSYRDYVGSAARPALTAPLIARSAFVAAVAAVVIVGLSAAFQSPAPVQAAGGKSDRLAYSVAGSAFSPVAQSVSYGEADIRRNDAGQVVWTQDAAARTTSVAKGAAIPLSPSSPFPSLAR